MSIERSEDTPSYATQSHLSSHIHTLLTYLKLTRPDHWFKNLFILPGFVIAYSNIGTPMLHIWQNLFVGILSACLAASANYILNEWLDREFDQFHPVKKLRPCVTNTLQYHTILLEYLLITSASLGLAWLVTPYYFLTTLLFLAMGIVYNIQPLRTKDILYLDVLSESVNNPIRLLLGWFMVTNTLLPPSSLLLAYWMGGAYLMAIKRFSEYKFINDRQLAGLYRRSFQFYSEEKLLISSLFYATCSAFFGGVFLIKYKAELILTLPLYALLFSWYMAIGFKPDSAAQHPEAMHEEKRFLLFVIFVAAITIGLLFIHLPFLDVVKVNIFGDQ